MRVHDVFYSCLKIHSKGKYYCVNLSDNPSSRSGYITSPHPKTTYDVLIYCYIILKPIWVYDLKFEFQIWIWKNIPLIKYHSTWTVSQCQDLPYIETVNWPVNLKSLFLVCFNGILTAILFEYRQHACIMYFNLYGNDDGLKAIKLRYACITL